MLAEARVVKKAVKVAKVAVSFMIGVENMEGKTCVGSPTASVLLNTYLFSNSET
jgi:hypothetical protein